MERHPMLEIVIKLILNLILSASSYKPLDYFDRLNRNRRLLNLERVYDTGVSLTFSARRHLVYTGRQNF